MNTATLERQETDFSTEEVRYHFGKAEYDASCVKFEKLANLTLRNSDTVILGGYGCYIRVRDGALSVEYAARSNGEENNKVLKLHRGTHKINQIILLAHGGYLTFDAIEWCCQQNITVYLMNYKGELLQVLTPKQPRNARLTYLQFQASENDLALSISIELITRKVLSQIETLKKIKQVSFRDEHVVLNGSLRRSPLKYAIDKDPWKILENGLQELERMKTLNEIRSAESQLSRIYWWVFTGFPIKWHDKKNINPHWLQITKRASDISGYQNAHRANNPFHSILNFAYALLQAQVLQSIIISGLEPTIGYLHTYSEKEGKNSLVFDLMECFRSAVDYLVLSLFQKTTFKKGDFYQTLTGEVRLNEELRRYILASCRVDNISIDKQVRWLRSTLLEKAQQ